jgi:hypothetical protein
MEDDAGGLTLQAAIAQSAGTAVLTDISNGRPAAATSFRWAATGPQHRACIPARGHA